MIRYIIEDKGLLPSNKSLESAEFYGLSKEIIHYLADKIVE